MHQRARRALRCGLIISVLAFAAGLAACSSDPEPSEARKSRWQPRPTTAAWQFQLQGKVDRSIAATVFELDGFDTPKRTVDALEAGGKKAICYIDAGSWERFRPDARRFPRSVLGRRYEGYPDERWLDIRRFRQFSRPLVARVRMCAAKGFDGIEPDNVNGWENRTGFPITARHQLRFNRWIARVAHRYGLAVALKNDGRQARQLVRDFDFAVVEQCFQYNECGQYLPFIRHGKAVFAVEYELPARNFCARARKLKISAIGKRYELFARPWRPCSRV